MRLSLIVLVACLVTTPLHAQQSALSGAWYGVINGYTPREPRRTLNVVVNNGTLTCTWQEMGKGVDYPQCSIQSDRLTLTTGAGSKVELFLKDTVLEGTFTLKNGRRFALSMGREPIPVSTASVGAPVTCAAAGYWEAGTAYLIVKSLNSKKGTVDIEGIPAGGAQYRWKHNHAWAYKGNQLEYNGGTNVRYRLSVEPNALKGSYENFNAPTLSRHDLVYLCDGPTERVIVR